MKRIHMKLMVSASLCGALLAGPALGQASYEGTGEIPRALTEDIVPVEGPVRRAPPTFDPDEVERALELDPGALRDSFGTVGRTATGEEIRQPPSDEVIRALEDAFNAEGAVDRQVFGDDDRVQVNDGTVYPFTTFGLVHGLTNDGVPVECSGALIGPRTVLTAAHCLFDHDEGWFNNFLFLPGMTSLEQRPFGAARYEAAYIVEGYEQNYLGYYGSVLPWDLGVLVLNEAIGDNLGWLGFAHDPDLGAFHANIVGYPADKPYGTMWRSACDISPEMIEERHFGHHCDTYGGSSGSPVYRFDPDSGQRIVYGVNVAGSPEFNAAVRINSVYFNWIKDNLK